MTAHQKVLIVLDISADSEQVARGRRHGAAILVNLTEDTLLHGAHCDVPAVRLK